MLDQRWKSTKYCHHCHTTHSTYPYYCLRQPPHPINADVISGMAPSLKQGAITPSRRWNGRNYRSLSPFGTTASAAISVACGYSDKPRWLSLKRTVTTADIRSNHGVKSIMCGFAKWMGAFKWEGRVEGSRRKSENWRRPEDINLSLPVSGIVTFIKMERGRI